MSRRFLLSFALIAVLAAAGCSRGPAAGPGADEPALRAALNKYLSERTGLNLPAMDIVFRDIRRTGEGAEADVEFVTRDGQGAMQMTYVFEQRDGAWRVTGAKASGMTTDHPVPGAAPADAGALPPGHPPVAPPEKSPPPKQP